MGRLQKLVDKGLVAPSKNPADSPVVFVRKKSAVYHDCLTLYQSNGIARWGSLSQPGSTTALGATVEENEGSREGTAIGEHHVNKPVP
jgi:hypothetical protein